MSRILKVRLLIRNFVGADRRVRPKKKRGTGYFFVSGIRERTHGTGGFSPGLIYFSLINYLFMLSEV